MTIIQPLDLNALAPYVSEGAFPDYASKDFRQFFAGRDDLHGILEYLLGQVTTSLHLNMYGYDDERLNDLVMAAVENPNIECLITLDKSQAGGVHEKRLLQSDAAKDPEGFKTRFVIGQSATHQISHTKGFVANGAFACSGSANWSESGEGTFVIPGRAGGPGYKAQNNTMAVYTCAYAVGRFKEELILEHKAAGGLK